MHIQILLPIVLVLSLVCMIVYLRKNFKVKRKHKAKKVLTKKLLPPVYSHSGKVLIEEIGE